MKKIMMATIVVAISVVSGWNISQNKSNITLSDVALANVEALAVGENNGRVQSFIVTDGGTASGCIESVHWVCTLYEVTCIGTGNLECPGDYAVCTSNGECFLAR